MSKLCSRVVYKLIDKNCTSKEIQFMLFLAQYQDKDGICHGIYYKDAMNETPCCKQSFYAILKSLQEKEIISVTRESQVDYDILIIGNTEDDIKASGQYLYARTPILHTDAFRDMPAFAKMIAIDLILLVGANRGAWDIGKNKFKERYFDSDFLPQKIEWKTFLAYIREIKKILMVKPVLNSKGGIKYVIKLKLNKKEQRPHDNRSDSELSNEYYLKRLCLRSKFSFINTANLIDAAGYLTQYFYEAKKLGKDIFKVLKWAFESSIEKTRKFTISPPLIHAFVRLDLYDIPLKF